MTTKLEWQRERIREEVARGTVQMTPQVQAFLDGKLIPAPRPPAPKGQKLAPPLTEEQRAAVAARDWSRFHKAKPTQEQRDFQRQQLEARIAESKRKGHVPATFPDLEITSRTWGQRVVISMGNFARVFWPK